MSIDAELQTEIKRAVDAALQASREKSPRMTCYVPASGSPVLLYRLTDVDAADVAEDWTIGAELREKIVAQFRESWGRFKPAGTSAATDIEPLVRVVARAVEVLGTSEKALRWINTPVASLGDRTPLSLLESPEGLASVEASLTRIEYGVW
jgi:putative toxin-antitoxin system antitoxin component (TIGR02293 family)